MSLDCCMRILKRGVTQCFGRVLNPVMIRIKTSRKKRFNLMHPEDLSCMIESSSTS